MKQVVVEEVLDAPADRIWEALTDKDQLKKWYFDLPEFKAEIGFEFTFVGQGVKGENYTHLCKVTQVIPRKKLQYSWQYENYQGYSLVTFELLEEEGKTRLRLTHSGLDTFPEGHPDFRPENFKNGWTQLAGMLADHLSKTK